LAKAANGHTPQKTSARESDERWIIMGEDPSRELKTSAALATASRVLKDFNPSLSAECLLVAQELWVRTKEKMPRQRLSAAVELYKTTGVNTYSDWIILHRNDIVEKIDTAGWVVAPVVFALNDKKFTADVRNAMQDYAARVSALEKKNPYSVPSLHDVQSLGIQHYFLHSYFPDIFPDTGTLNALNVVLGPQSKTFRAGMEQYPGYTSVEDVAGFVFLVLAADQLLDDDEQ
jgi:hypothetical protein